jgi:hypothetical protein
VTPMATPREPAAAAAASSSSSASAAAAAAAAARAGESREHEMDAGREREREGDAARSGKRPEVGSAARESSDGYDTSVITRAYSEYDDPGGGGGGDTHGTVTHGTVARDVRTVTHGPSITAESYDYGADPMYARSQALDAAAGLIAANPKLAIALEAAAWRGLYKLNPVDPERLKAPGFNPRAYQVKTRFQSLGFQMQLAPLQRGPGATLQRQSGAAGAAAAAGAAGASRGACTSSAAE